MLKVTLESHDSESSDSRFRIADSALLSSTEQKTRRKRKSWRWRHQTGKYANKKNIVDRLYRDHDFGWPHRTNPPPQVKAQRHDPRPPTAVKVVGKRGMVTYMNFAWAGKSWVGTTTERKCPEAFAFKTDNVMRNRLWPWSSFRWSFTEHHFRLWLALKSEPIFGGGDATKHFSVKKRGFQWKGGRQFSEWGVW